MLKIENVSKFYSGKTALDHISIDIQGGRVFGLLGPNGAGKTSLIRIITMITAPDTGRVLLDGTEINSNLIRKIGYLPEERGLYRKMTILDQALYFAQLKGMQKADALQEINTWFSRLEMDGWKNKKVEYLSKGMQQKVQFVITVLHRPQLIILDEPFTGFDPVNAAVIKNEILALKAAGTTVILSTHRMESVEELCDDIALINNAKLIIEGNVTEVRNRFRLAHFSIDYTGELPENDDLYTLQDRLLSNGHHRAIIELKNGVKSPNELLSYLINHINIHEFKELIPSVNDIFIQMVEGEKT